MGAIFGFGAVTINQVVFTTAIGELRYKKEFIIDEQKDEGTLIQKFKWRAYARVKLPNFDSTDQANLTSLLQNINFYKEHFTVNPQNGFDIIMNLISDFTPEAITDNNKGQWIPLEFRAVDPVDEIPAVFYNQPVTKILTEDSKFITTEDGKYMITEV